jgi:hypothetical protein
VYRPDERGAAARCSRDSKPRHNALTMDRRLLISLLACWPARQLLAEEEPLRPRHKISAAQLHAALSARFPQRFGPPELLEVELSAPQLLLLPARQKLGATVAAQVTARGRLRPEAGEVDVVFAVRWEPGDQTIRAYDLELLDLRWPGLPRRTRDTLRALLPGFAREAVGEFVLHRFAPRELGLADTMGLQPEQFRVVEDGLVVVLGPKTRR